MVPLYPFIHPPGSESRLYALTLSIQLWIRSLTLNVLVLMLEGDVGSKLRMLYLVYL